MIDRRPRIAVSTGPLWQPSLEESFAAVRAAGAEGVEILVSQDTDTQSPRVLERLAERYDLPIVSIHAPQLLLTRQVYTPRPLEKIRRTLELTRALDVRTIVLHPPYLWQLRYATWVLDELAGATAGSPTTITMENMFPVALGGRKVGFHRFQGLDGLERFADVTLDTSHLALAGEDIVQAYRRLADKVVAVHLSDNRGKGRDSHAPLGEGILPIAQFVQALDPARLQTVVLELSSGFGTDREELERALGSSVDIVRDNLPAQPGPPSPGGLGG